MSPHTIDLKWANWFVIFIRRWSRLFKKILRSLLGDLYITVIQYCNSSSITDVISKSFSALSSSEENVVHFMLSATYTHTPPCVKVDLQNLLARVNPLIFITSNWSPVHQCSLKHSTLNLFSLRNASISFILFLRHCIFIWNTDNKSSLSQPVFSPSLFRMSFVLNFFLKKHYCQPLSAHFLADRTFWLVFLMASSWHLTHYLQYFQVLPL